MITSMICIIFWMIIIPIILGYGIIYFDKTNNKNICLAFVIGIFVELIFFEILSIPITFFRGSFLTLKFCWAICILILTMISMILNKKCYRKILEYNLNELKKTPKTLLVFVILLVIIQCYYPLNYMYEDYDDSNFVAKATVAIDTNTLFVYDDAGNEYLDFPIRQVFSEFPYYTATIASLTDTHPAVLAHTVFPVIFIIIAYSLYYILGLSLFKKDYANVMIFLIFLSTMYIFGNYSRYTTFVRLLCRAWQGKSLVANLTIPCIWYIFIEYIGNENNKFGFSILFLVLGGSTVFSSMAFILPLIEIILILAIYAIKKNKDCIKILVVIIVLMIILILGYIIIDKPIVYNETVENNELSMKEKIKILLDEVKDKENMELLKESFERAGGGRFYFSFFILSVIYILCKENYKESNVVLVFSVFSILVLIICFNPFFSKIWSWFIGREVYWRMYWLLPIGYTVAYVCTKWLELIKENFKKIFVALLILVLFIWNGDYVFTKHNFKIVDNYYKVPDLLLEIIFNIMNDEEEYKKVGGPEEAIVYMRQIDGTILLPHERCLEYWDTAFVNVLETKNINYIYERAKIDKCNYIIVNKHNIDEEEKNLISDMIIVIENEMYILYKILS